jgi:hypothetical protein
MPLLATAQTPGSSSWCGENALETQSQQAMCQTLVM